MPFTLAHPAAIVPLHHWGQGRRWTRWPLSALAVGSMTPDLEYLLRLSPVAVVGHTAAGLVLFCLPVGWLALWTFHRLIKTPAIQVAPERWRAALWPYARRFDFGGTRALRIAAALVLGAATHDLWDACTHQRGFVVRHLPSLNHVVFSIGRQPIPLFHLLQHASGVVGLTLLAWLAIRWRDHAPAAAAVPALLPVGPWRRRLAALVITLAPAFGVLCAARNDHFWKTVLGIRYAGVSFVVGALAGTWAATLLWGLAARVLASVREPDRESSEEKEAMVQGR